MFEFTMQLVDAFLLDLIDDILLDYHVAHALFLLFVLVVLGGLVTTKSLKVLGVNFALFGLIFVLTPVQTHPVIFQFFGLALLVTGPMIVVIARN